MFPFPVPAGTRDESLPRIALICMCVYIYRKPREVKMEVFARLIEIGNEVSGKKRELKAQL